MKLYLYTSFLLFFLSIFFIVLSFTDLVNSKNHYNDFLLKSENDCYLKACKEVCESFDTECNSYGCVSDSDNYEYTRDICTSGKEPGEKFKRWENERNVLIKKYKHFIVGIICSIVVMIFSFVYILLKTSKYILQNY